MFQTTNQIYIYIYTYYDICFLVKWGIPKPHSGFLKWFQTRSFNTQMDFRTWIWGTRLDPVLFHALHVLIHTHLTQGWEISALELRIGGSRSKWEVLPFIFGALFGGEKPYFLVTFPLKSIHERILSPFSKFDGHRWPEEKPFLGFFCSVHQAVA